MWVNLYAHVSRISTQKPRVTILAAIVSQAKNGENGAFQEVLPVRRSHIRTVTLRAWSCSPHETGFGRCTDSILCRSKKTARKMGTCLGTQPSRTDPYQRPRAIARCSGPVSLDHLPRINQGREVQADNIHLQFDSIVVLNHGSNEELVYSPKESSLHVLPALVFPDGKELLAAGLRNNALSIEVIRISLVAHEAVDLGEISGNFDPAWGEREKPSYSARP